MSPEIQQLLLAAMMSVISIVVPLLTRVAIQYASAKIAEIRARTNTETLRFLDSLVADLVKAAEQNGVLGLIQAEGAKKKAWVIARAQDELNRRNMSGISVRMLSDLVEAKIHEGIQKKP